MSIGGERPDKWAVRDDLRALTRTEFDALLSTLTESLTTADLGPERRVAVYAENSVETAVVHLAAVVAGCSAVPVNFHLTADEVAYILGDSGARVLFVGPETAERGLVAARSSGVPVVAGWRSGGTVVPWTDWAPPGESPPGPVPRRPGGFTPGSVAPRPTLVYTSGTTGFPKGTELPPALFPRTETVAGHLAMLRTSTFGTYGPHLVVAPMYHVAPLVCALRAMAGGMPVALLDTFDAERTLAAVEAWRIATAVMVPTHFIRLLRLPPEVRKRYDTSSLRQVLHTGASCPVPVKQKMIDWWGPVLDEVYGASEVGTTCSIDSQGWLAHPGSVGRPVPPFEAVVVDDAGNELPAGTEGRLYFRDGSGRGVVYHNDPARSAAAHLAPGVFTLGEVGYVDEDGYVYITDRFSDMVVSGGVNIYPAEAEQVLAGHPDVIDVACIGVAEPEMGEQLIALVVPLDPAAPPDPDELIAYCRQRLASYKCPRSVTLVDSVGRTPLGKVNKRALREAMQRRWSRSSP